VSEHQEQVALFWMIRHDERFRWLYAVPNGGKRYITTAIALQKEGVRAGVWDLFLPVARHGAHGLYIEMKFGNNKLTPSQREFGEYVKSQGYKTAVCWSAEEAYDALNAYWDGESEGENDGESEGENDGELLPEGGTE
jgi:hypothetical protein